MADKTERSPHRPPCCTAPPRTDRTAPEREGDGRIDRRSEGQKVETGRTEGETGQTEGETGQTEGETGQTEGETG